MSKVKIGNIIFNVFAIITAIAVAFVGVNIAFKAKGYAVTSDSMKGELNRGDAVFVRQVSFESLQIGDVITVDVDGEGYFTHRIADIDREAGTVTTKGDANISVDPMPTKAQQIVGKMWYSVPLIGYISIVFTGVSQVKGLIILALVAIALITINTIISKKRRGDNDEKA